MCQTEITMYKCPDFFLLDLRQTEKKNNCAQMYLFVFIYGKLKKTLVNPAYLHIVKSEHIIHLFRVFIVR